MFLETDHFCDRFNSSWCIDNQLKSGISLCNSNLTTSGRSGFSNYPRDRMRNTAYFKQDSMPRRFFQNPPDFINGSTVNKSNGSGIVFTPGVKKTLSIDRSEVLADICLIFDLTVSVKTSRALPINFISLVRYLVVQAL